MAMATEKHFSLVSKKASIWFFLAMASNLIQHWPLYYLDKKNVFHVIYRRKFTLEKPPSFVVWGKSQWAHKSLLQTQKQCPWVWLVCFKTLFKNLAWLMLMLLIWFSIRINPLSMNQPYLYGCINIIRSILSIPSSLAIIGIAFACQISKTSPEILKLGQLIWTWLSS